MNKLNKLTVLGFKCSMSTMMNPKDSTCTPVTLIYVPDSYIQQVKTIESDGYTALQLGCIRVPRPTPNKIWKNVYEARGASLDLVRDTSKQKIGIEDLSNLLYIDIKGKSKGKGFAGVVKRHGFAIKNATHGNSLAHRTHGSTGTCTKVGRVLKGKKMAGHMGFKTVTVQCSKVVYVNTEHKLIAVRGSVPGPKNSALYLSLANKKPVLKHS